MGFAWCGFFAAKWILASISYLQDAEDHMLLEVLLALFISLSSMSLILVLDKVADADWTDEKADEAIRQIIGAIGILVGFSWEQCFDTAVLSLSLSVPNYKHIL